MMYTTRLSLIGFVGCLLGGMMASANGADVARERFEERVFKTAQGSLPYRLLKPKDYDANQCKCCG